jgi:hypothetical protein
MTRVGCTWTQMRTHLEEEAEIGAMCLPTQEPQGLPATHCQDSGREQRLPLELLEVPALLSTGVLEFWENISVC